MCMIVKIDKLSHEMRGIAKIDNKVTFVDKVIPNEVVNIRITKQKKKINEAKLVSIIEKSPNRIEPKCKYYNICGGCNTEHISYNKSVIYKKEIVKNIFNKYCNMNIEPSIIYDADNTYNYRNKITLRIKDGKLSLVGDTLINIDYCYLVNNNINEVIKLLNSICLDGVNEVVIRGTDDIMVIIKGDINSSSIISILDGKVNSIFINNIKVYGNDHIIINVGNYSYAVYADSFFQVNTNMIDKLYNKVLEYAGTGNKLLDLYCGSGTIGIYLAHNFNTVIGIEQNKDAIKGANLNKKINNIHNISFICKQVSEINQIESDVVVVDPPRSGLDNTIMNKIMNSNIDKLVYVSCNPITLSRDINILKNKYNLVEIQITLDGLEEKHDQRRPLRNGGRTFHKIIENVINAKKFNGRFLFRVSFDRNNSNDVKELLNYISKLKISNEYQVYLAPIHNTTSQECMHCSFCNTNVYDEATDIIKQYKELYSYMKYLGLSIPKYYTNGPCMVVSNDTVLIDPYGDIYKCVEMISLKETCVGNVKDKNYNQTYYSFVGLPSYYKCIKNKCKYVCLCGGGCLMANYLKCKKIKGINCEYEYFKELIPFFLEENYDE